MELVEEEHLPGCFELLALVLAAVERGQRGEGFRLEQPVLGLAVELLDPGLGGQGTPVQLEVELAGPPGESCLWERLAKNSSTWAMRRRGMAGKLFRRA